MLLVCLAVWFSTFLFLTFSRKDLPLIGLLFIAIAAYFIGYAASREPDAIILLAGVTLGKGTQFLLKRKAEPASSASARQNRKVKIFRLDPRLVTFLFGLVMLLAFGSWWHLDVAHHFYPGTRWTGLWDNPNIYGMLMGAGVVLAIGLLAENLKSEMLKAEIRKAEASSQQPENFALFCGYQIRNPQSAIRTSTGCGGDDGRWVVFQLQPRGVAGDGHRLVILGQSAWQIQMAVSKVLSVFYFLFSAFDFWCLFLLE